jgi:hypothetical protein
MRVLEGGVVGMYLKRNKGEKCECADRGKPSCHGVSENNTPE